MDDGSRKGSDLGRLRRVSWSARKTQVVLFTDWLPSMGTQKRSSQHDGGGPRHGRALRRCVAIRRKLDDGVVPDVSPPSVCVASSTNHSHPDVSSHLRRKVRSPDATQRRAVHGQPRLRETAVHGSVTVGLSGDSKTRGFASHEGSVIEGRWAATGATSTNARARPTGAFGRDDGAASTAWKGPPL